MKGTSSVRRVRLRSFCARILPPMCFATSRCVCARSSMRFLKSLVADCIGMAASLSSFDVATCEIGAGLPRDVAKRIVMAA